MYQICTKTLWSVWRSSSSQVGDCQPCSNGMWVILHDGPAVAQPRFWRAKHKLTSHSSSQSSRLRACLIHVRSWLQASLVC
jgi:hypothetical protein